MTKQIKKQMLINSNELKYLLNSRYKEHNMVRIQELWDHQIKLIKLLHQGE